MSATDRAKKTTKELALELGLVHNPTNHRPDYPKKRVQIFDYFIIIDFESTCWENKENQPHKNEIIEFPAVLMNAVNGEIEDTFHHYVMPTKGWNLSDFCKKLTGISQETVNNSSPLGAIMRLFSKWVDKLKTEKDIEINSSEIIDAGEIKTATYITWSDWDLGTMLNHECRQKGIYKASHFNRWNDLRATYRTFYNTRPQGLNGALSERGIMFSGRQHSGIDDAKNTARLAFKMITDGCCIRVTKDLSVTTEIKKPSGFKVPVVSNVVKAIEEHNGTKVLPGASTTVTAPLCKCGRMSVRKKTLNGGPNHGQHYFSCKISGSSNCGYFVWERTVTKQFK